MRKANGYEIKPYADLRNANLRDADLRLANLNSANLRLANLNSADLRLANLNSANLWDANLSGANLSGANLRDANLRDANLSGANLSGANLRDAKLDGADLRYCLGNNCNIFTLQLGAYQVTFTSSVMAIGCQQYSIVEWFKFTDKDIYKMDRDAATLWWSTYAPILKTIFKTQGIKTS